MEKEVARRILRDNISSYRLERNINVYNNMRINSIAEAFRVNSVNIAMFPPVILGIGSAVALLGGAIYVQEILTHPLTKRIKKLRDLEYSVATTDLASDITEDDLENMAKIKLHK